uniref:Transposase n=1 Tax=Panagrellus redivivus TaxID=6233 RepID=A0A7E4V7K8_PANRE
MHRLREFMTLGYRWKTHKNGSSVSPILDSASSCWPINNCPLTGWSDVCNRRIDTVAVRQLTKFISAFTFRANVRRTMAAD